MGQRILFRCDGGKVPEIGTGHVRRCLLLADYLRRKDDAIANFLMRDYPGGGDLVRTAGFRVDTFPITMNESEALKQTLALFKPDLCVFDVLNTEESVLSACHQHNAVVVCLDDLGAGLEHSDIVINAILESPSAYYWGPEYVVLPEFSSVIPRRSKDDGIELFVSCGGYDHRGLARRVLEAVSGVPNISRITVVGGDPALKDFRQSPKDVKCETRIYDSVSNLAEIISTADVAVVSGGLTFFEAMRSGVPSIVVPQYDHQFQTALRYEQLGVTISLGFPQEGFESKLKDALNLLLTHPNVREGMTNKGRRLVDGKGIRRVADIISICRLREWDTAFFDTKIASLNVSRLTEPIVAYALRMCEDWQVNCLYYLADCHHPPSVRLAEKNGFHFADIRLTFEYDLESQACSKEIEEGTAEIRSVVPADVPHLREIAGNSYKHSRYYFDERFPREKCRDFYAGWIEKSSYGYADQVLVAEVEARPAGYVTCCLRSASLGAIELIGVDDAMKGKGLGKLLVRSALDWFKDQGAEVVEVVTQGRNYDAQRLYQRCGFITKMVQLWYHKWFDR